MEGVTTSTSSEFEKELDENKVQFVRIRDKNINFVLCHFQRFVIYLQRECFNFYFEIDIERNLCLLSNCTLFSSNCTLFPFNPFSNSLGNPSIHIYHYSHYYPDSTNACEQMA